MKGPASRLGPRSAAGRLRVVIETAEAGGAIREDMTLRLTHRDVHDLKRDGDLAVDDISFVGGVMRYLGVKVKQGGVVESVLDYPAGRA